MKQTPGSIIQRHLEIVNLLAADSEIQAQLTRMAELCVNALNNDHKILFCGNGGSAADAQHLAAELSGKFMRDRRPLYAEALHVNSSYITAVSNDYGFEVSFARLIHAKARKGDILIGLSTSGNSENVIKGFIQAGEQEVFRIAWTGKDGGELIKFSDMAFRIPSDETPRIQEMHILLGHILCEMIESELFDNDTQD